MIPSDRAVPRSFLARQQVMMILISRGSLRAVPIRWVLYCALAAILPAVQCGGYPPKRSNGDNATSVPDAAARQKAEQAVRNRHKSDFSKIARPDARMALGKTLWGEATDFTGDPAERYVLFDQAAKLIAEAGDVAVAASVIEEMSRVFQIDSVAVKANAAKGAVRTAKDESQVLALIEFHVSLIDEAIEFDQFEMAGQLATQLIQVAKKADSAPLKDQMQERAKRAQDIAVAYREARPAEDLLRQNSDDPKANRTWGRFLCFYKGDWTAGLPFLEKADTLSLSASAKLELSRPGNGDEEARLADDWSAIAEKEKGLAKNVIQDHAHTLYVQSQPYVSDIQAPAIDQKILKGFGKPQVFQTSEKGKGVTLGGTETNVGSAFTLELWVSTKARDGYLITKRHEESDGTLSLVLTGGRPAVYGNASFYLVAGEAKQPINDGNWHHLAAVKRGMDVDLFVDGRKAASVVTREQFESNSPWVMGFFTVGNQGQLDARFCRVRISNVARYLVPFIPDRKYGADKYTAFMP